ncbi:MAG TPA: phosphopantetheine-binding protein [Terriglobales bacterium]|nr:phosphopantetheine-binding protein [Terriglobales bacterium]
MADAQNSRLDLPAQLRQFILTELAAAPNRTLDLDTALFETLLDSTSVLVLVSHLEERYQIQIQDHELVPANFSTLRQLTEFIARKTQLAAAPMAANG